MMTRNIARVAVCLGVILAPCWALAEVTLYTTNSDNQHLYTLDVSNAAAQDVGAFGVAGYMAGLGYDSLNDVLYGTTTDTNKLYTINRATGAATFVGDLGASLMHGLAYDTATGTLYGAYGYSQGDGFYSINTSTGAATLIGHVGYDYITGLAISPQTGVLYACRSGPPSEFSLLTINKATGQGTFIGTGAPHITGLAAHPDTAVLYGMDNWTGRLYTIDLDDAGVTLVGTSGLGNPLGLAFVPEPASLSLLALGGLALLRRRSLRV